ncbi:L-galactose dehydrogenase-like [Pogonomyrmex barbatus]|uniref:L-galactose dehydrogenase-like n=1 Tax=Pogonomyrmex barbatus TaxID=144034 RepID=A0A6I9WNB0_9HYME|nr:L-galactose dehydrogenase-like [Pogonomyrmex barbatus]XP_011643288.1 L-galactose dehydrogenase-like [Pogonomyrmex barbatus]XP_011643289.1 L-galactose dehydrogenase-like [Pogonomyrmex barbatus]
MFPPTYVEGFHDPEAVKAMEYKELGKTGLLVSKLAFGCGPLGCHYGTYDEADAIEAVRRAIKQGINYIDTAPWYGQGRSEATLGKALKGIPREAYYIATKIGRYELDCDNMFNFTIEKTRESFKKSLEWLGVDYVDVIQVHDIEFAPSLDIIVTQTLPELSRQVAEGRAKHIGITGYPVSILKECIEKSNINIACILSYARLTLIDDTLLEYVPFFKKHKIGLINAATLSMGLLTNNGPPSWHPASDETKKQCVNAAQYCQERNVEFAKLAIWHSMQYTDVDTNLVGIQTTKQLQMNLDVIRNGITEKEKALLKEIQVSFLSAVKNQHWEGKEIRIYQEVIKNKI